MLPVRAQTIQPTGVVRVLGEQVPTWLPEGFGLVVGWRAGDERGGSNGAIWTDESCRRVVLEVWPNAAAEEPRMLDGRWKLVNHSLCDGRSLCLEYYAHADGDVVALWFYGVSEDDAASVVAGVRV
jgi:hypothetical protein